MQLLASPGEWVFGVLGALFVLAAGGRAGSALPESSPRVPGALASLRPSVHVPRASRRAFLVVLPCLAATWALGGLYASLGPSLVAGVYGVQNHVAGGLLILALNGTGIVGSLATRGLAPSTGMVTGALVFVVGVLGTIGALATGSLAAFYVAAVVSGLRVRRGVPGRDGHRHPRGGRRRARRAAVGGLHRQLPGVQPARDRRGAGDRPAGPDPDRRALRRGGGRCWR